MQRITWIISGILVAILAVFLHYTLPRQNVVRVVNVEVQRIDTAGSWFYADSEGTSADGNRDVKIIHTIRENGSPKVYRNEDTGWGWPPFFKFNSSNVQAKAAEFSQDRQQWVVVKSYGWRSQMLSIYPNALKVTPTTGPGDKPLPVTNILILLGLGAGGFFAWRGINRFWDKRIDPMVDRVSDVFEGEDGGAAATEAKPKSFVQRLLRR